MRLLLCCAALALALVVGGCGSDEDSSPNAGQTSTSANSSAARRSAQPTAYVYANKYPKPRNPGAHPGARVDQLVIRDIRKGIGPAIQAGDSGTFEFIATNYETGDPLESSWHRRRPFETQIEKNVVIDGWWQGIPGMRVGGRRQIIVPPSLGFTQNPELIGATTYFDVVLTYIRPLQPAGLEERGGAGAAGAAGGAGGGIATGS